jgi:hypothetical protein
MSPGGRCLSAPEPLPKPHQPATPHTKSHTFTSTIVEVKMCDRFRPSHGPPWRIPPKLHSVFDKFLIRSDQKSEKTQANGAAAPVGRGPPDPPRTAPAKTSVSAPPGGPPIHTIISRNQKSMSPGGRCLSAPEPLPKPHQPATPHTKSHTFTSTIVEVKMCDRFRPSHGPPWRIPPKTPLRFDKFLIRSA